MEFIRKKKRGQSQKVQRTWFSEEGYRIVWRREVYGVCVPARFQACVRVLVPYSDGQLRPMWDFVNHNRRLMKTRKAAKEECKNHKRLWAKACEATGIRALKELFGGTLPLGLPLWTRKRLDRRLYAILIDNRPLKQHDDEEAETCTESSHPPSDAPGPGGPRTSDSSASPTEATPASPTRALHVRDKASMSGVISPVNTTPSSAKPAKEPGKGRKKPAAKRTKRVSKHTAKRKTSTTDSPVSGAKRSRGSRKTKSKPSGK